MTRSSQWEVFRRCLHIIVRLERGAASREEMLALVYPEIHEDAAIKRFENDLKRLRDSLDIEIGYNHHAKVYELFQASVNPLLDLPDQALYGLAFLEDTFEIDAPKFQNVQTLLGIISSLLSTERRAELARVRTSLDLDLRKRDEDTIDETVWNKLETAHRQRRLVLFNYQSPQQDDQQPRQHLVEPRKLYFDTARHHYYLWGYCRNVKGPQGQWQPHRFMRYRIGRIVRGSVQIESARFPANLPTVSLYDVIYQLPPQIARLGVSHHFENMQVEERQDGTVMIHAQTDDVFYAARTVLYYGAKCKVLGGAELLHEIRRIVQELATLYEIDS